MIEALATPLGKVKKVCVDQRVQLVGLSVVAFVLGLLVRPFTNQAWGRYLSSKAVVEQIVEVAEELIDEETGETFVKDLTRRSTS